MKKVLLILVFLLRANFGMSQAQIPSANYAGGVVTFTLPDDFYDPETYLFWWFGDGSYLYQPINQPLDINQPMTHIYALPGNYVATLEVMKKRDGDPPPSSYAIPVNVLDSGIATMSPFLGTNNLSIQISANNQLRAGDTFFVTLPFQPCDSSPKPCNYTFTYDHNQLHFVNHVIPTFSGITAVTNTLLGPNSSAITFTVNNPQQTSLLVQFAADPSASGSCILNFVQNCNDCNDSFLKTYDFIAAGEPYDPNKMEPSIVMSDNCDLSGKYIHYSVEFQNIGDGPTEYVLLKILKDPRLIAGTFEITGYSHQTFQVNHQQSLRGAFASQHINQIIVDSSSNKDTIYVELHGLILQGLHDPGLQDEHSTKGRVNFRIKVGNNGLMGQDIICQTDIIFNTNIPVQTNIARTSCCKPEKGKSGGSFLSEFVYWIIILILLIINILLLLRRRKKI